MASANSWTFQIIVAFRAGARLADVIEEGNLVSATEKQFKQKNQFSLQLQDGEYTCKTTLIGDAVGIGMGHMTAEKVKSFIKMNPNDDGGMGVKVECSFKIMPVPGVEAQVQEQDEIAETSEKIIAESKEMGGASNFKVKLD